MPNSYEFSEAENGTFRGLVQAMSRAGVMVVVSSVILLAYNLVQWLGISLGSGAEPPRWVHNVDYLLWFIMSAIGVVVGLLLVRATAGFVALINTQGDDINHLMKSIAKLTRILKIVFAAGLAGAGLLVVSLVLLVMYS